MATDFLTLLHRDHHDLEAGLTELLRPEASIAEIRASLDGVRLGLTAHSEAEDIILDAALRRCDSVEILTGLVEQGRAAHLAQEGALAALVCAVPGTAAWRARARHLLDLVHEHAAYEEAYIVPAIRELAPAIYASLAGAFATERMRQLAMLQPSAVFYVPELARAS